MWGVVGGTHVQARGTAEDRDSQGEECMTGGRRSASRDARTLVLLIPDSLRSTSPGRKGLKTLSVLVDPLQSPLSIPFKWDPPLTISKGLLV